MFPHGRTSGDLAGLGGDRVTSRTGRWGYARIQGTQVACVCVAGPEPSRDGLRGVAPR